MTWSLKSFIHFSLLRNVKEKMKTFLLGAIILLVPNLLDAHKDDSNEWKPLMRLEAGIQDFCLK